MSLFSSIANILKPVAAPILSAVGNIIAPGAGGVIGGVIGGAISQQAAMPPVPVASVMPGAGVVQAGMFPSISTLSKVALPAVAGAGRAILAGAKAVPRAAANLCRKYPTWCSTIGGTLAVEALFNNGQLPMPKRRRGRGITAHELRAFKRVARFTSKYCAPVHRAMRAPAMRRSRGASCR